MQINPYSLGLRPSPNMSVQGSGMFLMMALQQQLMSIMYGLLSTMHSGFGEPSGVLPGLANFGGPLAQGGSQPRRGGNGLQNFLGGKSGPANLGSTPAQRGGSSRFNVASFNVLGSSHTAAGGNKPGKAGGVSRMRGAVAAMKSHNVDIAGMQEFQKDQQAAFKRMAPNFGVVAEKDNAVVYNKDKFKLLEKRSVSIPYFEGHMRKMPVVKLQDKATGKKTWVVNIHNPAERVRRRSNCHRPQTLFWHRSPTRKAPPPVPG